MARAAAGDDVAGRPCARDGPVELDARRVVAEIAHLQHLMGQLVQRIASQFGSASRVGRSSRDLQQHRADPRGRQGQAVARAASLAREDRIVLRAELRDQPARPGRAHFLVGVDQHGDELVVVEVERAQGGQRMQDQRDAVLVVGDPETVRAPVAHPERLVRELTPQGRPCPCGPAAGCGRSPVRGNGPPRSRRSRPACRPSRRGRRATRARPPRRERGAGRR